MLYFCVNFVESVECFDSRPIMHVRKLLSSFLYLPMPILAINSDTSDLRSLFAVGEC